MTVFWQEDARKQVVAKQKSEERKFEEKLKLERKHVEEKLDEEMAELVERQRGPQLQLEEKYRLLRSEMEKRHTAARKELSAELQRARTQFVGQQQMKRDQNQNDFRSRLHAIVERISAPCSPTRDTSYPTAHLSHTSRRCERGVLTACMHSRACTCRRSKRVQSSSHRHGVRDHFSATGVRQVCTALPVADASY